MPGPDMRPAGRARCRRVPAHLQHAPRDGGRADRGRTDRADPGGNGAEDNPDREAPPTSRRSASDRSTWSSGSRRPGDALRPGRRPGGQRRGAATVGLACNRPSLLGGEVDLEIAPLVGAEVISGSTRLKAGTATKMILNMISTGAMVQIGKTLGNRMVDLRPTNEKLRLRSRRILRELAGVNDEVAVEILGPSGGRLEVAALVVALAGVEPEIARSLLDRKGGQVRLAVRAIPTNKL